MEKNMKTAGETALEVNGYDYENRKRIMRERMERSDAVFMVYVDDDMGVCTMGVASEGNEGMLLELLAAAGRKAVEVAEEAMV